MQTLSVDQLLGQRLGNYRVERLVAQGRLRAVFLVRNLSTQQVDALTLYLIPEHLSYEERMRFLARFRKEASAVTTLEHPHILPVYECGEVLSYPYLITPYMTHGSLADRLKKNGRYTHSAIAPMFEQLVSGIAYAHSKGFIHGTLRPSNVVISPDDTVLVAGFGLMHMLQSSGIEQRDDPFAHLLCVAGTCLVAPEYIAPEVVQGQSIDQRSDVYALGCILFELLCGHPPFSGKDPIEVAQLHVKQTVPALHSLCPDLPPLLISVVSHALERDPERRFQRVSELGEAFLQASYGASSGTQSVRSGSAYRQQEEHYLERTFSSQNLQDTPSEGYPSGKWQLMPPIVTGHMPSIPPVNRAGGAGPRSTQAPAKGRPVERKIPDAAVTMPGIAGYQTQVVARKPAIEAIPTMSPQASQLAQSEPTLYRTAPASAGPMPAAPVPPPPPAVPEKQGGKSAPVRDKSQVTNDPEALAKEFAWWSQPGDAELAETQMKAARKPQAPRTERSASASQVGGEAPQRAGNEPLILHNSEAVDWTIEPLEVGMMQPGGFSAPGKSGGKRSGRVSRRQVIALAAAGGVAVAGTALALNLGHFFGRGTQMPTQAATGAQNQTNAPNNQMGQQLQNQPANGGNTMPNNQPAMQQNGTIIGRTTQAKNSYQEFKNTADGKNSLLVRLPDGNFVANERACTHEGVFVNYNPATKLLECPAHGALFDPAKGGAVVQGPATMPLPKVAVKVNADGSITL